MAKCHVKQYFMTLPMRNLAQNTALAFGWWRMIKENELSTITVTKRVTYNVSIHVLLLTRRMIPSNINIIRVQKARGLNMLIY